MPSRSYPTAYRGAASRGPQSGRGSFWSHEGGFLGPEPGSGMYRIPDAPSRPAPTPFRLPPAPQIEPLPYDAPDLLPGQPGYVPGGRGRPLFNSVLTDFIPEAAWRLAPWALFAYWLWDVSQPHGSVKGQPIVPSNWTHVCGPFAYPGAPYRNQIHWTFNGASSIGTCLVPLPGQALTIDNNFRLPPFNDPAHTLIFAYGPNEALLPLERWYTFDQYSVAAGPVSPAPIVQRLNPLAVPTSLVPYLPPLYAEPFPTPTPLRLVPSVQVSDFPFATVRGDLSVAQAQPHPHPHPHGVRHIPITPDVRPTPVEREHKSAGKAAQAFRALSQLGSWNSLTSALWRSLPKSARTRHANTAQKIRDLLANYDQLDLGSAAYNLGVFWLEYKAAGWSYGRIYRYLVDNFGNTGVQIYRGLMSFEGFGPPSQPPGGG